ncbi:hypothetical protein ABKN59_006137 [Abortiporus biennis]
MIALDIHNVYLPLLYFFATILLFYTLGAATLPCNICVHGLLKMTMHACVELKPVWLNITYLWNKGPETARLGQDLHCKVASQIRVLAR